MHHDLRIQNWKLDVDAQTHTKLYHSEDAFYVCIKLQVYTLL